MNNKKTNGSVNRPKPTRPVGPGFRRRGSNQAGFSLIELLVVVAIILIISAIAIPGLLAARKSANNSAAAASLKAWSSSANVYQSNYQVFPGLAANMKGAETTAAASAIGDKEIDTATATALDGGLPRSGFTFTYKAIPATLAGTGGAVGADHFEITAIPTSANSATDSFCVDHTGSYHTGVGATTFGSAAQGTSCNGDGYTLAMGQ